MTELDELIEKNFRRCNCNFPDKGCGMIYVDDEEIYDFSDVLINKLRGKIVDNLYEKTKLPIKIIKILLQNFDAAY